MKLSSLILSACTWGRRPSSWSAPHQAPPVSIQAFDKVVRFANYDPADPNQVMLAWYCEQWK